MKIVTIVGARPQFVKAATISRVIEKTENVDEVIVHTGQHFDQNMSDIFFDEMSIPKPHYHLEVNSLGHGAMTGRMLEKIEDVLLKEKPDWVLVYGDTNSTIAGALAARKLHIKVAHVEAGLRSFNMRMPEEVNRTLTDRISDILFCPTTTAVNNLQKEGYDFIGTNILNVGDVMFDAAKFYEAKSVEPKTKDFVLCTLHRAENTDSFDRMNSIVSALNVISKKVEVVLPLHPRTEKKLKEHNLQFEFETIKPVGYFEMIGLLKDSKIVMTDSGGLQKEAYFFESPCITMRDETEWVELVESKANILVGSDKNKILMAFNESMEKGFHGAGNLYGSGDAASKIVDALLQHS